MKELFLLKGRDDVNRFSMVLGSLGGLFLIAVGILVWGISMINPQLFVSTRILTLCIRILGYFMIVATPIVMVLDLWCIIASMIRRFHDINRKGEYVFIFLGIQVILTGVNFGLFNIPLTVMSRNLILGFLLLNQLFILIFFIQMLLSPTQNEGNTFELIRFSDLSSFMYFAMGVGFLVYFVPFLIFQFAKKIWTIVIEKTMKLNPKSIITRTVTVFLFCVLFIFELIATPICLIISSTSLKTSAEI